MKPTRSATAGGYEVSDAIKRFHFLQEIERELGYCQVTRAGGFVNEGDKVNPVTANGGR